MKLSFELAIVKNYESFFQAGVFVTRKDYRITERLRLTPGGQLATAQAGSPKFCCLGLCPDCFSLFPRAEIPQSLCATRASVWSSSQLKSVSLWSDRSSCSVYGHCLLSGHWTPPFLYLQVFIYIDEILQAFFFPG